MDLAVYISELLGLHGEVNVPEIGYFAQIRTNGYYNKDENKFYPPGHDISFQPQFTEDDALARYISGKKNISLASSRYFIDKYVGEVKQHAATQRVEIAGLGYLQSENSTLSFQASNTARDNDPAFYGLQPVKVYKADEKPAENHSPIVEEIKVVEQVSPVKDTPAEAIADQTVIATPTVITPEEQVHDEWEYTDEEAAPKRFLNVWVILLLILTIVGLALLGIYQYKPSVFDKLMNSKQSPVVKPAATAPATQPAVTPDTVAKKQANPPAANKIQIPATTIQSAATNTSSDSSKRVHYEILGGAFVKLSEAEKVIDNYKKMGFDSKILDNVPGKLHKISLGTYYSQADAVAAEDKILSTKKISKKTIYIQYYKPRK